MSTENVEIISGATDLVTIESTDALSFFTSTELPDRVLAAIKDQIDEFDGDIGTVAGRKAIASMAHKIARTKTFLDDAGKRLVDRQKEIPKRIDATRKHIRDTLDKWRDDVRAPLPQWEAAEAERVRKHKDAIAWLGAASEAHGLAVSMIEKRLEGVSRAPTGEACEEFAEDYAAAKAAAEKALRAALSVARAREAERAELERLQREAAEREQKDRERRIADEAAERAKAEAERKAREETERAARREAELRLQAEAAERRAVEAEQRAKADAEAKRKREADEAQRRAENAKNRRRIHADIHAALVNGGVPETAADIVVGMLDGGTLPHIEVLY